MATPQDDKLNVYCVDGFHTLHFRLLVLSGQANASRTTNVTHLLKARFLLRQKGILTAADLESFWLWIFSPSELQLQHALQGLIVSDQDPQKLRVADGVQLIIVHSNDLSWNTLCTHHDLRLVKDFLHPASFCLADEKEVVRSDQSPPAVVSNIYRLFISSCIDQIRHNLVCLLGLSHDYDCGFLVPFHAQGFPEMSSKDAFLATSIFDFGYIDIQLLGRGALSIFFTTHGLRRQISQSPHTDFSTHDGAYRTASILPCKVPAKFRLPSKYNPTSQSSPQPAAASYDATYLHEHVGLSWRREVDHLLGGLSIAGARPENIDEWMLCETTVAQSHNRALSDMLPQSSLAHSFEWPQKLVMRCIHHQPHSCDYPVTSSQETHSKPSGLEWVENSIRPTQLDPFEVAYQCHVQDLTPSTENDPPLSPERHVCNGVAVSPVTVRDGSEKELLSVQSPYPTPPGSTANHQKNTCSQASESYLKPPTTVRGPSVQRSPVCIRQGKESRSAEDPRNHTDEEEILEVNGVTEDDFNFFDEPETTEADSRSSAPTPQREKRNLTGTDSFAESQGQFQTPSKDRLQVDDNQGPVPEQRTSDELLARPPLSPDIVRKELLAPEDTKPEGAKDVKQLAFQDAMRQADEKYAERGRFAASSITSMKNPASAKYLMQQRNKHLDLRSIPKIGFPQRSESSSDDFDGEDNDSDGDTKFNSEPKRAEAQHGDLTDASKLFALQMVFAKDYGTKAVTQSGLTTCPLQVYANKAREVSTESMQLLMEQVVLGSANPSPSACCATCTGNVASAHVRKLVCDSIAGSFPNARPLEMLRAFKNGPNNQEVEDSARGLLLFPIEPPLMSLHRGSAEFDLQPIAVPFWDTLGLAPASGPKDVTAFCIYPRSRLLDVGVQDFLNQVGGTYQSRRLGQIRMTGLGDELPGLLPVDFSEPLTIENMLDIYRQQCNELGQKLAYATLATPYVAIYLLNPFKDPATLLALSEALQSLKTTFHSAHHNPHSALSITTLILPLSNLFSFATPLLLSPSSTVTLVHRLYDQLPPHNSLKHPEILTTPSIRLASPLPTTIPFSLHPIPPRHLFHQNSTFHLAYACLGRSLSAAWIDDSGMYRHCATYDVTGHDLSEIIGEIWDTTIEILRVLEVQWTVFVAKVGSEREPLDTPVSDGDDFRKGVDSREVDIWASLFQQTSQTRDDVTPYLLYVDPTPLFDIVAPEPIPGSPPNVATTLITVRSFTSPTSATIPKLPHDQHHDPNQRLVDTSDIVHGAIFPLPRNIDPTPYTLHTALASGLLVRNGQSDVRQVCEVNVVLLPPRPSSGSEETRPTDCKDDKMEIDLTNPSSSSSSSPSPHSHETDAELESKRSHARDLLRTVLVRYRALGVLRRFQLDGMYSLEDGEGDDRGGVAPWHVEVARRGAVGLDMCMPKGP